MASDRTAKAFGIILRESRIAAELSQEKLALEADRDRTFVGKLERGKKLPTLETLFRLASVLEIAPGLMVTKTAALVNFTPGRRKRSRTNTPPTVSLGEETCSRCKAVYRLHVRKSSARTKGKFRCGFCESEIDAWTGRLTQIYTVLHPPKGWRK
jgi:transcriptional regulator with XRE-family HTH domain